jgi:nucleoside-diphosphate-sugar epimerase
MSKVLVTGANGMLGKSVINSLINSNHEVIALMRKDVDLTDSVTTLRYIEKADPDAIIHCAALVGGIQANISGGGKFLIQNLAIDNSVLNAAKILEINNLIYVGSSCMYPANRENALTEDQIMTGPLEKTNENYALAKIVGSRMVEAIALDYKYNWRTFIASNLYGPNDHFGSDKSHLLSAIISKAIAAKKNKSSIDMWGDGKPRREFTYVDDFSDWISKSINNLSELPQYLNLGIGVDYTVKEFYQFVLDAIDYKTEIIPNLEKPSGNMRKLMDSSKAKQFGWDPRTSIQLGITNTVNWYSSNKVAR